MARLSKKAQLFIGYYSEDYALFRRAAAELQDYIAENIADLPQPIHVTQARAKQPESLRSKCRRKGYKNPAVQVTDLLAVRVITYFKDDLDAVAARLRNVLQISEAKSRDTRKNLAENAFGYRSVHLVARLKPSEAVFRPSLARRWFEIQVRSILDHAWSEIEHEAVYKSGIRYSKEVRRRFKAVAASLEVLEDALAALTTERDKLIARYHNDFQARRGLDEALDVARLQAFLEFTRPHGLSWRSAEQQGQAFPRGSATASLEALDGAGLTTPRRLAAILQTRKFINSLVKFAALEGIAPEETSHLAIIVLAVAISKPTLLQVQFPEMLFSPAVASVIKTKR